METPSISQHPRTSRAKTVAILAIAVVGALAVSYMVFSNLPAETEFKADIRPFKVVYADWKKKYNIYYGGPEDNIRFKYFEKTHSWMQKYNLQFPPPSFRLSFNAFSAMSDEEFSSVMLGYNPKRRLTTSKNVVELPTEYLRENVDWTTQGAVQPVKYQGSCGSCWAFSAVGALEGLSAIKRGKLQDFSEQELVDCSTKYGNQGCNGGLMTNAFNYVKDNGISTQSAYPYKASDQSCKATSGNKFKITGYANVPANNSAQLKAAIERQPVSVAVQADSPVFRHYTSGVLTSTDCGTNLNHGVLVVGYHTTGAHFLRGRPYHFYGSELPHYIVKNSWGPDWGDRGYIRIAITEGAGVCGIQMDATYPTL